MLTDAEKHRSPTLLPGPPGGSCCCQVMQCQEGVNQLVLTSDRSEKNKADFYFNLYAFSKKKKKNHTQYHSSSEKLNAKELWVLWRPCGCDYWASLSEFQPHPDGFLGVGLGPVTSLILQQILGLSFPLSMTS